MSFLAMQGGPYANILSGSTFGGSPAPDVDFGYAYLADGRSNVPCRLGSSQLNSYISADVGEVGDPEFADGVSEWTQVSGATLTQSATAPYSGTYSAALSAAGVYSLQFSARAGQNRRVSAALKGDGTYDSWLRVYCVDTDEFLQADGSWDAASAECLSQTATTWDYQTLEYQTPVLSGIAAYNVTLKISIGASSSAGTTYRDLVNDVAGATWASIHGHNLALGVVTRIESSDDGSSWTTRATATVARDSFYATFTLAFARYWRIYFVGDPPTPLAWLGEWVLGEHLTLTAAPDYPVQLDYEEMQTRQRTVQGAQYVTLYGSSPLRRLTMRFTFTTDAEFQQIRDVLFRISRGGAYPSVWAPDTDSDVCIFGRVREALQVTRSSYNIRTAELEVEEEPLPVMS